MDTEDNWESICDNCGKCCYIWDWDYKDNKPINPIKCEHRDDEKCICTVYKDRNIIQPKCGQITKEMVPFLYKIGILPDSCEYVKILIK